MWLLGTCLSGLTRPGASSLCSLLLVLTVVVGMRACHPQIVAHGECSEEGWYEDYWGEAFFPARRRAGFTAHDPHCSSCNCNLGLRRSLPPSRAHEVEREDGRGPVIPPGSCGEDERGVAVRVGGGWGPCRSP